jgi:hypothetical protein
MIKVILSGGFGNQIFQYAAGRALAIRHSTNLVLNLSLLNESNSSVTPRRYELDNLNVFCSVESTPPFPIWRLIKKFAWLLGSLNPWKIYQEDGNDYDPRLLQQPDGVTLIGYWQSYIYSSDISTQLKFELQPRNPLSEESIKVLDSINSSTSIAIHVRRGDYATNKKALSYHGLLPLNYYRDSVAYVLSKFPEATFFIFSDDQDWCKKNLNLQNEYFVEHNKSENPWEDLVLMSKCKHHIIANSSFSWWAAWIADNNQKNMNHLVVAPKHWFIKSNEINNVDRFPPHWITL